METQKRTRAEELINLSFVLSIIVILLNLLVSVFALLGLGSQSLLMWLFFVGFFGSSAVFLTGVIALITAIFKKEKISRAWKLVFSLLATFSFFILPALSSISFNPRHRPDASIKSNVDSSRTAAELFYDSHGSYVGVCASEDFAFISRAVEDNKSNMICFSSKDSYCVRASLVSRQGEWCIDDTGYSGPIANCSAEHNSCK